MNLRSQVSAVPLIFNSINPLLDPLVQLAMQSGASKAAIISTDDISTEERLANLCKEPQCKNYGLSLSCPPHVSGPAGLRKFLNNKTHAIVIRIDLLSSILFSEQRREVMQLLHEIVAGVEQSAVSMGYKNSQAFAGSSCKEIFCYEHAACQIISNNGKCRYPQSARPSMSGYGINVSKLMAAAGWSVEMNIQKDKTDEESMSWVAGLVIIG